METEPNTVHRHTTRVDTCQDCLAGQPTPAPTTPDQAGGDRGGKRIRVLSIHPVPVWAYVFNEHNGMAGWVELDQATLVGLVDSDLTEQLR